MSVDVAEAAMSREGARRLEVAFFAAVEADDPRFLQNLLRLHRDGVGGVRRRGRLGGWMRRRRRSWIWLVVAAARNLAENLRTPTFFLAVMPWE
jgi:hypothetical protein